jgi:DNA-binding NarL/FixJ family response regulator
MRVLLAGRPADRDRLRPQLVDAGLQIVSEALAPPSGSPPGTADSSNTSDRIDAVVIALPTDREGLAANGGAFDLTHVVEPLTNREREVLALLAEGLPNKAIAGTLGISDQTVKFHVAAIIGKLGAANRTDAVRRAVRRGLVAL